MLTRRNGISRPCRLRLSNRRCLRLQVRILVLHYVFQRKGGVRANHHAITVYETTECLKDSLFYSSAGYYVLFERVCINTLWIYLTFWTFIDSATAIDFDSGLYKHSVDLPVDLSYLLDSGSPNSLFRLVTRILCCVRVCVLRLHLLTRV